MRSCLILVLLLLACLLCMAGCIDTGSSFPDGLLPDTTSTNKPFINQDDTNHTLNQGMQHEPCIRKITDMKGRIVEIPENPSRVAVFSGPLAQIPYILGIEDSIIATTPAVQQSYLLRSLDPRLSSLPTPRGATGEIDLECLTLLNPDLVIAPPLDGQLIEKRTAIPVVMVSNTPGDSMIQIKEQILFLGDIFNRREKARAYCEQLDEMNAFLLSHSCMIPFEERKLVFCGYDASHLMTYGNDTFLDERISLAGGINAGRSLGSTGENQKSSFSEKVTPPQSEVTLEQVIAWDPDVIIIDTGSPDELYRDPRWRSITAVRDHQVYLQPYGIFKWSRQNAESGLFYPLWLAKILYPDYYGDVSIELVISGFYRDFFSYHLTRQEIDTILGGGYQYMSSRETGSDIDSGTPYRYC